MKNFFISLIYIFFLPTMIVAKSGNENLLKELDEVISNKKYYHKLREDKISHLKDSLRKSGDVKEKYDLCGALFYEYLHYQADSSLYYINMKHSYLPQMNKPELEDEILINRAEVFGVMGMYNEAEIELDKVDLHNITNPGLIGYYYRTRRACYGWLADYTADIKASKYYKKINHIKNFSLLFSSSSLCADRVPINHPDYELYAQNSVSSQQGYIVFLDIYFPLHPDLIYMQRMHGIDVHEYQESLRIFFDKLENKTGKKIIIAAHPKALYNGNEFGKREIIKFDTVCLVQNADMVLLHTSNSISFPILYDKAIALITNHAYNKSPLMVSSQRKLASVLDLPIFNIDEIDIESFSAEKLSSSIRNGYIYTYLTSKQSEHLLNKNIIVEKLSHIK